MTEAVAATRRHVSVIFVPARFAKAAVVQAAEGKVALAVLITEGIPVRDMSEGRLGARGLTMARWPGGPSGSSVPTAPASSPRPAATRGIIGGLAVHARRTVGIVSRSGDLTYEIAMGLTRAGPGQSTCVGIGGDPVPGIVYHDIIRLFEADPQTRASCSSARSAAADEERAAEYAAAHLTKPLVAFIAGFTAPTGKRMGHAGAIISGSSGTAAAKAAALEAAGIPVARRPDQTPGFVAAALAG